MALVTQEEPSLQDQLAYWQNTARDQRVDMEQMALLNEALIARIHELEAIVEIYRRYD